MSERLTSSRTPIGPAQGEDLRRVLESTTEMLRGVLDSTGDGILVVDVNGRIVTYNQRFADMWRMPEPVLASRDDDRALATALGQVEDPDGFLSKVQQVYAEPDAESFDVLELSDERTFERVSRPWRVGGVVKGRVWSFRDVTAQRQSEEKLRASELYFRSLTEKTQDLVAIIGTDAIIRYASPSHETVLGYRAEDLVGTDARNWIHPDDLLNVVQLVGQTALGAENMPVIEFRFRHRDGSWRIIESVGTNLSHRPDIGGLVINSRDVTAKRRAEMRTQTLLAIAADISGHVNLDEVLARVQRRAVEALPADAIAVICEDQDGARMRVIAHHGLPAEMAPLLATMRFAKSELPTAARSAQRETLTINDLDLRRWLPESMHERSGTGSLLIAPFEAWSRHFGILVAAAFGRGHRFDADQASLCTGIARQLALAMEATDLDRAQREEAEVASALARVGRDLIAHVHLPDFLDRLCQSTAEVLHSDLSSTLLKRSDAGVFVTIAGYGFSPQAEELARVIEIPVEHMAGLLERLRHDDVSVVTTIPEAVLSPEQQREYHVASALCMALRRGDEIVGVQVANRDRGGSFTPTELRIARGLAQSASLALSHASLVEELEEANRVRAEFVATVSHELRTPLNIILGYGDLLLTDTFGPLNEEQRSTLQRMDRRARELLDLVNSTLEVSRIERGRVPIEIESTSLAELLAAIEVECRELQERAGVPLRVDLDGDVELRTDRAKLKVVLKNLLVNALKFTEQGEVTVRVAADDDTVTIAVTDTGIGIAPDDLEIVFQAFRQVQGPTPRTEGGVGLGLFIVARFVELLQGRVTVESQVGAGSTFRVVLPRAVRAARTAG